MRRLLSTSATDVRTSIDRPSAGEPVRRREGEPSWPLATPLAGLPERGWHTLRHTFGTHAAQFGVNPWRLMIWMGHKRIDMTIRYVHMAEVHMREVPAELREAAADPTPDRRIIRMLSARILVPPIALDTTPEAAPTEFNSAKISAISSIGVANMWQK